jgi:alkylation response protein AidB-like acyl-CoA dehydrogenase
VSPADDADAVAAARRLADDVLFPDAMRVDDLDALPVSHLDALAAEGLYGAPVSRAAGGLGLDLKASCAVTEELASGCLTTTFVWLQNRGVVMTLAADGTPAALRDRWLAPVCQGKLRGGIALGGLLPGPPRLRAEPAGGAGEWRLDGEAPWVTGWGLVDLLLVVARTPEDSLVTFILDAAPQPGLTVERQRLSAVNASVTVRLGFDGVLAPAERVTGQVPFDPAESMRPDRLRINGSLALGVARRCCRLIGPGPLDDELAACREQLDEALDAEAMAQARASASELAVRAAAALSASDGSKSVMIGQHPQRLVREAQFLLVFGSRPAIKAALMRRLGATR